jgi:DNA-directed RNA polymerase specialized sigma24 family protein
MRRKVIRVDIMKELKEIRWLKLQLQKDQERLDRLRAEVGVSVSKLREAPSRGSAVPDIMAEMIVKMEYITEQRLKRAVDIEMRILEVENAVNALPKEQRMVMRLRYFEGYSWREVMKTTRWSYTRCQDFHAAAVLRLDEYVPRGSE